MRSASRPPASGIACGPGIQGAICAAFGSADAFTDQGTGDLARHELRFASADAGTRSDIRVPASVSNVPAPDEKKAAAAVASECGLAEEGVALLRDEAGRGVFSVHIDAPPTRPFRQSAPRWTVRDARTPWHGKPNLSTPRMVDRYRGREPLPPGGQSLVLDVDDPLPSQCPLHAVGEQTKCL